MRTINGNSSRSFGNRLAGFALALALFVQPAGAQSGRLLERAVPSRFLGRPRVVQIYLPRSYAAEPARRYPVLYLHDGQNVFSSAGTNAAFGWGSWALDKTADELSRDGAMPEIILVAVNNSAERLEEYSGRTRVAEGSGAGMTLPAFEKYRAFLTEELKPAVDREFRTRPDAAHTGVMGSSLGGLCSLALAWEHPEVFGCAASLSGAFQVDHTNFLNSVLAEYRGGPKPIRIYLDSGVRDFTGGDDGRALTARVAGELRRIGWTNGLEYFVDDHVLTTEELEASGLRRDKWREAQSSQHNEFYWRLRSRRALPFLFPAGADR